MDSVEALRNPLLPEFVVVQDPDESETPAGELPAGVRERSKIFAVFFLLGTALGTLCLGAWRMRAHMAAKRARAANSSWSDGTCLHPSRGPTPCAAFTAAGWTAGRSWSRAPALLPSPGSTRPLSVRCWHGREVADRAATVFTIMRPRDCGGSGPRGQLPAARAALCDTAAGRARPSVLVLAALNPAPGGAPASSGAGGGEAWARALQDYARLASHQVGTRLGGTPQR